MRLLARRIERAVDDGDDSTMTMQEKQGRTVAQLLRSVGRLLIIALALLMTLNQFINIGPILAGAGILGLAVSFGAQSLVKDVINGFFMLVENSISVGDTIEIAGKTGTVERITLRVVRLRDVDGTLHVIPNGQITTVSNQTRGWSRAVVDVDGGLRVRPRPRPRACSARRRPGSPPTPAGRSCSTGRPRCSACSSSPSAGSRSARCSGPIPASSGKWRAASGSASWSGSAVNASPSPRCPACRRSVAA